MTYEEAVDRIPKRKTPSFWVSDYAGLQRYISSWGDPQSIALSPGGRTLYAITLGKAETTRRRANYNSAWAARSPEFFADKRSRKKPVIMFLGPAHGHEVEGLVGLVNLLEIMKTGCDLRGKEQADLRRMGEQCRLVILPVINPDGLARFVPRSLQGMTRLDMQFWGQGTWRDGALCGWPECKSRHPMVGEEVGFLGCYFNDIGVNLMHEEFFDCMSSEVPAVLDLARREAPDLIACLHSFGPAPAVLCPSFVPPRVQQEVLAVAKRCYGEMDQLGLKHGGPFSLPWSEERDTVLAFNLVSALHHTSGASAFVFECPHGLTDNNALHVDFDEILDTQLSVYRGLMAYALERNI